MHPRRKHKQSIVDLLGDVDLTEHFERVGPGKWTCIKRIGFDIQRGRIDIAPGTTLTVETNFMGVDMAFLLHREYERRKNGKLW